MPEGDTLHRLAAKLAPVLTGHPVVRVELPRTTVDARGLSGTTITGVEARGKNLLVHFSANRSLHVHLAMRGRVDLLRAGSGHPAAEVVAIVETDTSLVVVRSAPVARLVRTTDLVRDRAFRDLGPDVLAPTFPMVDAIRRMRLRDDHALGEVLLDQGALAGIGNVWKSEICFLEKLDPFACVSVYSDDELARVIERARVLMRQTVDAPRRRSVDPFRPKAMRVTRDARLGEAPLNVYDRDGERCYTCGGPIEKASQGTTTPRVTYWCPRCQPSRRVA